MRRRSEAGYLLEIPLSLAATAILIAIILPRLSPIAGAIAAIVGAIVILLCLFYMIVTPGWQPGVVRYSRIRSLIIFIVVAAVILGMTIVWVWRAFEASPT